MDTFSTAVVARLSIWVPVEHRDHFNGIFERALVPILARHGLVDGQPCPRPAPDYIASYLYALENPTAVIQIQTALQNDLELVDLMQSLLERYRGHAPEQTLQSFFLFGIYSAPAGPGESTDAKAGFQRDVWHSYGIQSGLSTSVVHDVVQDCHQQLWIATQGGGVVRYDGYQFTSFTTRDGLSHDSVACVLEDRQGRLWFGTGRWLELYGHGVCRFDGERFETFTWADGIGHSEIYAMLEDREGRVWLATTWGLSCYDGETFTTYYASDGLSHAIIYALCEDREGVLWIGTRRGVCSYRDGVFIPLSDPTGPGEAPVQAICEDRQGHLWFGTGVVGRFGEGVYRYDGRHFTHFREQDGLAQNAVTALLEDQQGQLWLGTDIAGLSRYDGYRFTNFTIEHGLANNQIRSLMSDGVGNIWVGTFGGGLCHYKGMSIANYTVHDGLASDGVMTLYEDRQQRLWCGTWAGACRWEHGRFIPVDETRGENVRTIVEDDSGHMWYGLHNRGLLRYGEGELRLYTTADEVLGYGFITCIKDRQGRLWIGTRFGLNCYADGEFSAYTSKHGLPADPVSALMEDRQGRLWVGTREGVCRYEQGRFAIVAGLPEGEVSALLQDRRGRVWIAISKVGLCCLHDDQVVLFTMADGLAHDMIRDLLEDQDGVLWVATFGGGVNLYDGLVWQTLSRRDGLAHDAVHALYQDRDAIHWIATEGGVVRYTPSRLPASVRLTGVTGDRRYELTGPIRLPASQDFVVFEFQGISQTTRPDGMVFVYRLKGYEDKWQPTYAGRVEFQGLPLGEYRFEVRAVDRDLNYSEPAAVGLEVVPDPRDERIDALEIRVRERTLELELTHRQLAVAQQQLIDELEQELQQAHDLQVGLMPKGPPQIEGYSIAGRCLPTKHVGGDFFQYFAGEGKLSICLADVTGHAMAAAVPVMMFSGVLKTEMRLQAPIDQLFGHLNRTMHDALDSRTFVCFAMVELDLAGRTLRVANAGCPYPYHYRASVAEITELEVDVYPLGVQAETVYAAVETALDSGDYIVLCSDGFIEASSPTGEMFGFERMAEVVRAGCAQGLSAEGLIARLIGVVQAFAGDEPQGDDMTCVVLQVD